MVMTTMVRTKRGGRKPKYPKEFKGRLAHLYFDSDLTAEEVRLRYYPYLTERQIRYHASQHRKLEIEEAQKASGAGPATASPLSAQPEPVVSDSESVPAEQGAA